MEQLFSTATTFPTVIFSSLLGTVVVYWIIGLLGLIDLDFDGDVELDVDAGAAGSIGGLTGFFLTFGLTGVPFTLIVSLIILVCWLISVYAQFYLLSFLPDGWLYYVSGAVVNVVIFFLSLPIVAICIRPLKGMFNSAEAATSYDFVGKEAKVATGSVSETFGQAKLFNDGAEILLDVRCDKKHELKNGDTVVIVEYSPEQHIYIVAPYSL
jgi:hypothetical protein